MVVKIHEEYISSLENPGQGPVNLNLVQRVLQRPIPREIFFRYTRQVDERTFREALKEVRLFKEAGNFTVEKAYKTNHFKKRMEFLITAKEFYALHDKDQFYENAGKEQTILLTLQKKIAKESKNPAVVGSSLCDTIIWYIQNGQQETAGKLAKQFGMSKKKFCFLCLRAQVAIKNWYGVQVLAEKKTPPIGFKPFAEILIKKEQYRLAEKMLMKVNEPQYQIDMFMHIENYMRAAEVAVKAKLSQRIDDILNKTNDPAVRDFIDNALAKKK